MKKNTPQKPAPKKRQASKPKQSVHEVMKQAAEKHAAEILGFRIEKRGDSHMVTGLEGGEVPANKREVALWDRLISFMLVSLRIAAGKMEMHVHINEHTGPTED